MKLPVLCVFLFACGVQAQTANNSNLSEHERDAAREYDRNTKYHNNADDHVTIDTDALAAKIAAGFKPPPKREVFEPKISAETERAWAAHDNLLAQYRAGDADAGFALGMSAYVGRPFSVNKEGAYEIWSSVADRNVKARYWAGRLLYAGEGTPADQTRGLALMESAKASGDAEAAAYLRTLSRTRSSVGEFPPMFSQVQSVFAWHRQRLVPYDAKREKYVGEMVKRVEQNSKKASSSDYLIAAIKYLYGIGAPQDLAKARTYLATARHMDPSQYNLDPDEHLMWLDLLEADKNPSAFVSQVEKYCAQGCNTSEKIYLKAMSDSLQHQASLQRYDLIRAIEYRHQDGDPPLPAEARVALAVMQLTGEGGPVDEASGLMNLRLVAANPHAQYVLARLAAEGTHGVQKDPATAQALMAAAARGGQPNAIAALHGGAKAAAQ